MPPSVVLTSADARRLAVAKQRLSEPRVAASPDGVLEVARSLRCIQLDPISVVERTQNLVLFSRLGPRYTAGHLDEVVWERKQLFHYWAHAASLVLTEDFPIHSFRMRRYPDGQTRSAVEARAWLARNEPLRRHILRRLRKEGPLRARDIEDRSQDGWQSSGWTSGRTVPRMLDFLWMKGEITIVGRRGMDRLWDVSSRWFPEWTPRARWGERRVVEHSTVHALRALGVATPKQITEHFTRARYPGLAAVLDDLVRRGEVVPVEIHDAPRPAAGWYMLSQDLDTVERLRHEEPNVTTLLSPFDNLIADRRRTRLLFGFDFTIEIYVPQAKRRFGYYVLPILHGDRLIGRVDARMDRGPMVLRVDNVYAEEGVPDDRSTGSAVHRAVTTLATWLGAGDVKWGRRHLWGRYLR